MSLLKQSVVGLSVVIGLSVWAGCAADGEDVASGDNAITGTTTCTIFNNQTGKSLTGDAANALLKDLNDPIAAKLLAGNCANTYSAALKKLAENDKKDCKDAAGSEEKQGLGSFLISETAAFEGAAAKNGFFRSVTTKTCEGRKNDEMIFSSFTGPSGPNEDGVEMIGKDATSGVYNFYELLDDKQWVFYGTSKDFITNGYDCGASGYCVSNNSTAPGNSPSGKSCASCHVSGGLIMKELDSPWVHWTAGFANGSNEIAKKQTAKLGNQQAGEDLELNVVRPSFEAYNNKRIELLAAINDPKKSATLEIVRPLFCTMDINLNSDLIGTNLMVDSEITSSFFSVDSKHYKDLKGDFKQHIAKHADKDDTDSEFTYPTRGQIDTNYSAQLQAAKLVDKEFVQAVLNVDFTRPIFSGSRCGILKGVTAGSTAALDKKLNEWAKASKTERKTIATAVNKGITELFKKLGGKNAGEKKLVENLTDAKRNTAALQKEADDFLAACSKRVGEGEGATDKEKDDSKKEALKEIMTFASSVRLVMRQDAHGKNDQALLEPNGRLAEGSSGPQDNKMVVDSNPGAARGVFLKPTDCRLSK